MNIKNITYAGNHGLDIVHPDGTKFVPPLPEEVNSISLKYKYKYKYK